MNTTTAITVHSDNRGDNSYCAKAEANADDGVEERKCVPI